MWIDRKTRAYQAAGGLERCQWCPFTGYTLALFYHEMFTHWDKWDDLREG